MSSIASTRSLRVMDDKNKVAMVLRSRVSVPCTPVSVQTFQPTTMFVFVHKRVQDCGNEILAKALTSQIGELNARIRFEESELSLEEKFIQTLLQIA
jgi:hypothetical protein